MENKRRSYFAAPQVHWRSDYAESLRLGEAIAIQVLTDQRLVYNEAFGGFTFTTFDGIEITV